MTAPSNHEDSELTALVAPYWYRIVFGLMRGSRAASEARKEEADAELRAIQARLEKLQAEAAASGPGGYYSLHELANSRPASSPGK